MKPNPRKLGKRLRVIESMVHSTYDHIWDCCCDHGLLGAALLVRQAAPYIHFVDRVPELIQELESKLIRYFSPITDSQWQTHCIDGSTLPLNRFNGSHLVIIAGVGGDLMAELVSAICNKHPTLTIDFLLCPVHHQFTLRATLIQFNMRLIDEVLLAENNRFYEIIFASTQPSQNKQRIPISPVGSDIWKANTPEQAEIVKSYFKNTLSHYKKMQLSSNEIATPILKAYCAAPIFTTH